MPETVTDPSAYDPDSRAYLEAMATVLELSENRVLTRPICQFILLALYPILQVLSFTAGLLDARLHLIGGDVVRHAGRVVGGYN